MKNAYEEINNPAEKQEVRDLALLAATIRAWAGPDKVDLEEALDTAWEYFGEAAAFTAERGALDAAPTLTSVEPPSLPAPGPDSQVAFHGTGFNEDTTINWNGGDEPTEFISETEVRTVVKPSTVQAPLPFTLPVYVHNAGIGSNVLEFTFTEAEGRRQ